MTERNDAPAIEKAAHERAFAVLWDRLATALVTSSAQAEIEALRNEDAATLRAEGFAEAKASMSAALQARKDALRYAQAHTDDQEEQRDCNWQLVEVGVLMRAIAALKPGDAP